MATDSPKPGAADTRDGASRGVSPGRAARAGRAVTRGSVGTSASVSAESGADANGGTTGANRAARRSKPESQRRVATPWGAAAVVEQAKVAQRAGAKRFATVLELLETTRGEQLVRIAYTTDGVARRGPVTLRLRDLDSLRAAVAREPRLAEAFDRGGGDA